MNFKFVSTRVSKTPDIRNGHLILSCDEYLWESSEEEDAIKCLFLDQFSCAIEEADAITSEHYQPKDVASFPALNNSFIPCAIAVDEAVYNTFIDISGFAPSTLYEESQQNLCLLGYEVATFFSLSAFWHGISPYSEGTEQELNQFGLFTTMDQGLRWAALNNEQIPEHAPWYLVALYVVPETKARLEQLLQTGTETK